MDNSVNINERSLIEYYNANNIDYDSQIEIDASLVTDTTCEIYGVDKTNKTQRALLTLRLLGKIC